MAVSLIKYETKNRYDVETDVEVTSHFHGLKNPITTFKMFKKLYFSAAVYCYLAIVFLVLVAYQTHFSDFFIQVRYTHSSNLLSDNVKQS